MKFDFNPTKNELLFSTRGVSFPQVIEALAKNGLLYDIPHPNTDAYPNQRIFVVRLDSYTYCVPYVLENNICFLKTIYPSRKFHQIVKGDKYEDK